MQKRESKLKSTVSRCGVPSRQNYSAAAAAPPAGLAVLRESGDLKRRHSTDQGRTGLGSGDARNSDPVAT